MLELLYTSLTLFGFLFPIFLIVPYIKLMKIFIISFQLIISFILLSKNFYKKHSLFNDSNFQYKQKLNFNPIKSLSEIKYENGSFKNISFDVMYSDEFSLIKTEKYSTKCLEYFFIKSSESCPIKDKYQNFIKIDDEEYLYYTNENKLGKLYKSFNYFDFKKNKYEIFTFDTVKRKEYNKLSNPIINFKFYISFCDSICTLLLFVSLFYTFFESLNNLRCGLFIFSNLLIESFILILYIIRFVKFTEIKNFLFENKDIYQNEPYIPNVLFNIDSFPLALSINLFLYNLLYIAFPNKISCFEISDNICDIFMNNTYYLIFVVSIQIVYFILGIFDFVNDLKIERIHNNLIYNWNLKPLTSVNSIHLNDSNYNFQWKNISFQVEKLDNFDYIKIYQNNNGKICGKDNYGNNLYFPVDIDCPINNIFVSKDNKDLQGYTKIKLINNNYLHYTNKYIEGNIIVEIRSNSKTKIALNPEMNSYLDFNSFPFYEEIDSNFDNEYLYSINYLGINTSSIPDITKIKKFKNKMKVYISISTTKIVLLCLENIFILIIFLINYYYDY